MNDLKGYEDLMKEERGLMNETNTPVIEQEELEKNYQRPQFIMIDYANGETHFFRNENELTKVVSDIASQFENFELNDELEFYNLNTGQSVEVRTHVNVAVTIV